MDDKLRQQLNAALELLRVVYDGRSLSVPDFEARIERMELALQPDLDILPMLHFLRREGR